jgi:acetyl-CoA C-acetyltransferase
MEKVYLLSAAQTPFGRLEKSGRDLLVEACVRAIECAGITPKDIDAGYVANSFGFVEWQSHYGPILMSTLGNPDAPCMTVASACASGSSALHEAYMGIAGGFYDCVLVAGFDRIEVKDTTKLTTYFTMGCDRVFEAENGATFPGLYALMASEYIMRYGATEEDLAHIAVKNHSNALRNPVAHIQKKISVEDVMNSPYIARPLKLLDCCPFSDGAAAAVLCSEGFIRRFRGERIRVVASSLTGGEITLHTRGDFTTIPSAVRAGKDAFRQARFTRKDIDMLEVHDCFTIAEAIALEDLGFAERGKGAFLAREGVTAIDGDIPVNPSGGLKAKGHPVSATGVAQVVEVYEQLMSLAGGRQINGAEVALTHNVGATGGSCAVHIFRRVK